MSRSISSVKRPRRRSTHCKRGHAFDPANIYHKGGKRFCRACIRTRSAAYYQKKKRRGFVFMSSSAVAREKRTRLHWGTDAGQTYRHTQKPL